MRRHNSKAFRRLKAEWDQTLLTIFEIVVYLHHHHPQLRRKSLSNLIRNAHIFILVSIYYRGPLCSSPMSWTEIEKAFRTKFFVARKGIVQIYIPERGGTFKNITMTHDSFATAMGLKYSSLGKSGIRNAVREGEKILNLVQEAFDQRPDLFGKFSIEPVRHQFRARQLVREQRHIATSQMNPAICAT